MNYKDLKIADALLGIADLGLSANALNVQTFVSAPQDVPWSNIRDILMNNFDWGTLIQACTGAVGIVLPGGGLQTAAIQTAAIAIRDCCIYGGMLGSSDPAVWAKLSTTLNRLSPNLVGAISTASVAAIMALRTPTTPTWMPTVTVGDVQTARNQP